MYVNPALLALYSYCIILGFLTPLTLVGAGYGTNLVNAMVMTFIMLWWAQLDALKRGRSISNWLRWLVALTGPIGLVVHFLQTRSIFGASLAIIATVLLALLSLVFVAMGVTFAWFACQLDFMQDYCRPEFLSG
jgi:uncharacterized protein YacL